MTDTAQRAETLVELTENERVVFDQLLAHKKSKQIARDLGLSFSAVEERIRSVRRKLGAPDRAVAVSLYAAIRHDHSNPVPTFQGLELPPLSPEEVAMELGGGPAFALEDSQSWGEWGRRRPLLETFDENFGPSGRVVLILACFVIVCLTLKAVTDIFDTLNRHM